MAKTQSIGSANVGNALSELLTYGDIEAGDALSYQTAKTIYAYHPLGKKMADKPIDMAMAKPRLITVPDGPENDLKEAFDAEWLSLNIDKRIAQTASLARVYGISSVAIMSGEEDVSTPLDFERLHNENISFNVLDPLNTAGSLVLNQDPNALDFQKSPTISVNGKTYHRSRTCILMHENPLYIEYTTSAFGFVGRSVYQRSLYPLKSYIQTMITNDMVARKAGLLIAKTKQPGSIVDNVMASIAGLKRDFIKEAERGNVLSIELTESIESLNFQNLEGPFTMARKNILEDIAAGADMPAIMLNNESFAEGFGEGVEDANQVIQYLDGVRMWLFPLYEYFDNIVMIRAWNETFYDGIRNKYPEYQDVSFNDAFYRWKNSFSATWPSLKEEPESKRAEVEKVKLQAVCSILELLRDADPENKANGWRWAVDTLNDMKVLFSSPLELDFDSMIEAAQSALDAMSNDDGGGQEIRPHALPKL